MRRVLTIAVLAGLAGCDEVADAIGVKRPEAALNRVDLVRSPSIEQLVGYGCGQAPDLVALACDAAGLDAPRKRDLLFSFDVVFDLTNENDSLPIPLVETLLGFTAFDTANLGAVCISFCDPDDDSCVPGTNVEGACEAKDSEDVDEPGDLVPSVEELVTLAEKVATDEFDNGAWRVIGAGETLESHIQFDLGIDPMLQLSDELLTQAVDDFLAGREVAIDVPYTVEGTLFFDVPELGRDAIGFGPFDAVWQIE